MIIELQLNKWIVFIDTTVTKQENEPKIATIKICENESFCVLWEKVDNLNTLSHEITELEASRLIPEYCGIIVFGSNIPIRCGNEFGCQEQKIRISEECTWPLPHMFASITFGCGIELKEGWLTLNADQCWCLLRNVINSRSNIEM